MSSREHLTVTAPSSPRPRATSGSQLVTPTESFHLRASSSSSDLRASEKTATPTKRPPPPPPPPRGSKLLNANAPPPVQSLLLRPVPPPPGSNSTTNDAVNTNTSPTQSKINLAPPVSPSRNGHSPRSSLSSFSPLSIDMKPAIPPRPSSSLNHPTKPEGYPSTPNSTFFEDEDINISTSPPDATLISIPTRQLPYGNGNGLDINTEGNYPKPIGTHFSDSSQTSTDSDVSSAPLPQRSSRTNLVPPPRPPPRSRSPYSPMATNGESSTLSTSSLPSSKITSPPPPLPVRRSTVVTQEVVNNANGSQAVPIRIQSINQPNEATTTTANERKALGASKLPPPPTRTIALGGKLPPARRPTTPPSSDEESGEEEEPIAKVPPVDLMPDTSTSSRRPPVLRFRDGFADPHIHVHPHSGCVALSGSHVVVAWSHHMKIYDVAVSEAPVFTLDTKEMGIKEAKITCMEFRPTISKVDRGYLLWVGTKEGHLFELDIRTGHVRGSKYAALLHPVTNIFRHGRSMVVLDESGKTLIYTPDPDTQEDISLMTSLPRVMRTTEKQDFVKLLDGKLWTAARMEHQGSVPSQKLPIIRVYDVFNPAHTGRSLLPCEHVGPVTSATIIPSQPGFVYMGHEEGYISIWELQSEDDGGYPRCVEVMKVSTSDILSLEGVNDRLWAGSRNGMISAYDVSVRPWLVTNCWNAHPGLPVMRLMINYFAIVSTGRLCVASVGRDEQLRLWDGLLGSDWVDKQLLKSEVSFSKFKDLTVLVTSWNCDSARPDSLYGDPANSNFLQDILHSVDKPPDVIVFGFQEVIDLESRKMVAKNVLLGGKKKPEDGGLSDKVTGAYKRWYERLSIAVKATMPKDVTYCVVHTESLVGLFSCIFVKVSERETFDDVAVTTIKRGMGGRYGNKGGIVARFVVGDSSICFINCHLAAGQSAVRQRNADIAGMLEEKAVFPPTEHSLAYIGGGDGSMVLDHEFVILNGDLNYRIDHRRDAIISAVHAGDLNSLLSHDQLQREIKFNRGCRLRGFSEGPLTFNPTYKYDKGTDEYDTSEKRRSPAWCDRILWRARVAERVRQLHYRRYETNVSDHRPVSAGFVIRVKTFDGETREKERKRLQEEWKDVQGRLLKEMTSFYIQQALI
ncbi:DNase I-like protein [Agrocybe pediades]|nr:DNase I-like protein [Agrocybe pediades]